MASGARHRPHQSRGFSAFNHQAPVSEPCKDLLRSILQPTPEKRATPAQILAHVWVAGGAAPVEQLQHAVEGIRHLRLRGLQKIVLQVCTAARDASCTSCSPCKRHLCFNVAGTPPGFDGPGATRVMPAV